MRRAASELAGLLGATLHGDGATPLTGVAIDSRAARPGDLFVALTGASADGHEFVADAAGHGAAAALVAREVAGAPCQLVVPDPLAALQLLAADERRRAGYRLVGITGSIAKTTTKEFLAALLGARYRVGATAGSRNSQAGLPAELCNQPAGLEWMVAELGMSHAGELDRLGRVARPDALVYTVIAPVHLEHFASVDAIAAAKAELIPHLAADGLLVLNAADTRVAALAPRFPGRTLRYGVPGASDLWVEGWQGRGLLGARFVLAGATAAIEVDWSLAGRHQAQNLLAAACTALALGLDGRAVPAVAAGLRPARRRGEVHRLASGVTVIDDSYNASPEAVGRLLELLADTPGRRVAVLGEMLELGPTAAELHRRVGRQAAAAADLVVAVGGAPAAALAEASGGRHVADATAALATARGLLAAGDVVLVKGSRGVGLDRLVDGLLEDD